MDAKTNKNVCRICFMQFETTEECLKHDLTAHSGYVRKKSKLLSRWRATFNKLNSPGKVAERSTIERIVKHCSPGTELQEIFNVICLDDKSLRSSFSRIRNSLEYDLNQLGFINIYAFGSIASKLALKDSDIDIYLDVRGMTGIGSYRNKFHKNSTALRRIYGILKNSVDFVDVLIIPAARVPIIKCKHIQSGFNIDINISCRSSVENTLFISDIISSDARIHAFILYLKIWAKNMHIIERGLMSSYCIIVMTIFFLQQPLQKYVKHPPILASIEKIQNHCNRPYIIDNINYAYNLNTSMTKPKLDAALTVVDLIREFFYFYKNFKFNEYIIAPYLGVPIKKSDLANGNFRYYAYEYQLNAMVRHDNEYRLRFTSNRIMCIQDPFNLTHNISHAFLENNMRYFQWCLTNALNICDQYNDGSISLNEFYIKLLYELNQFPETNVIQNGENGENIQKTIKRSIQNSVNQMSSNDDNRLQIVCVPTRNDLKALSKNLRKMDNPKSISKEWCRYYITAIEIILTEIYRFDIQLQSNHKKLKLDNDNNDHNNEQNNDIIDNDNGNIESKVWLIQNKYDLWTDRCHRKIQKQTFMEYQLKQTEEFFNQRYKNMDAKTIAKNEINIKALLTLQMANDYNKLILSLTLPDGTLPMNLCKKHPMRRFFNIFSSTLRGFNLQEIIKKSQHY